MKKNNLHNDLHGFQTARGPRTAIYHEKLWALNILEHHGIDHISRNRIKSYWEQMRIKLMKNKIYGHKFHPRLVIIQGDLCGFCS